MLKSKLFLVADRAIRDAESNNLSIVNILEDITAESYPILIQRVAVVCFLEKEESDPDNSQLNFSIYNNDKEVINHNVRIEFRQKTKAKTIIKLNAIPLNEVGIASFILKNDQGIEIADYVINLKAREDINVSNE